MSDGRKVVRISINSLIKDDLIRVLRSLGLSYQCSKEDCITALRTALERDTERVGRLIRDVYTSRTGGVASFVEVETMYAAAASAYHNNNGAPKSASPQAQPAPSPAGRPNVPVQAQQPASTVIVRPNVAQPTSTVQAQGVRTSMAEAAPVRNSAPAHISSSSHASNAAQHHHHHHHAVAGRAGHAQAQQARAVPGGLNLSNGEIARCLNLSAISDAEFRHGHGLFDRVHALGGTVVQRTGVTANHFIVQIRDEESVLGLGKTHKLQVRLLVYHPQRGEWVLSPIWPKESRLVVGGEIIFDTTSNNRLGLVAVGKKEPMPAVDVSKLAAGTVAKPLQVEFYTSSALPREVRWIVVASVVRRLSESALLAELLQRSPSEGLCRARVMRFFSSRADASSPYSDEEDQNSPGMVPAEELNMGSVSVLTKDPTSYGRIKYAARGKACDHLQCFDLMTYLTMNESARDAKWTCPLCAGSCEFRSLVLDSWFQSLLDKHKDRPNVSGFTVRPDGTAEPVVEEEDDDFSDEEAVAPAAIAPDSKRTKVAQSPKVVQQHVPAAPPPPKRKTGQSKCDAIELLDDDDVLY